MFDALARVFAGGGAPWMLLLGRMGKGRVGLISDAEMQAEKTWYLD